jgi:four helix bundle protein
MEPIRKEKSRDEFRFLNWNVYQDAKQIVNSIFQITTKLPNTQKFGLGDQLNRAAISIVLNIAEGSGKNSDVDMNHFFNIAMGSLNEVVAGLDIARDNGLISKGQFDELEVKLIQIGKQLNGFKKRLIRRQ